MGEDSYIVISIKGRVWKPNIHPRGRSVGGNFSRCVCGGGGGGRWGVLNVIFQKVLFALISCLTLYIGNRPIGNLTPPPFLCPCGSGHHYQYFHQYIFIYEFSNRYIMALNA